jgi:acylphosphatase
MNQRKRVIIHGQVQGVFFRAHTQKVAISLNIKGWVTNRYDGTVEAVFEGDSAKVEQMVNWCHVGSPSSHVEEVETFDEPYTGTELSFIIT